ncbi:hypothetical protein L1987_71031 [Smallanthus sonchifolius]|uniref:Uncharacterized protein n=1 Tax=Smallanthus sonchifolius TaxID=185202 RepID=A0ACB9AQZ1_9ASTR|nr:hypothetical protein L1987_71031 [Smallanthus sonchifolius]
MKKGELFLDDVNTQLKRNNITTDIKVDTYFNLSTTITVDEPIPGLKTIISFKVPDQRFDKDALLALGVRRNIDPKHASFWTFAHCKLLITGWCLDFCFGTN